MMRCISSSVKARSVLAGDVAGLGDVERAVHHRLLAGRRLRPIVEAVSIPVIADTAAAVQAMREALVGTAEYLALGERYSS